MIDLLFLVWNGIFIYCKTEIILIWLGYLKHKLMILISSLLKYYFNTKQIFKSLNLINKIDKKMFKIKFKLK